FQRKRPFVRQLAGTAGRGACADRRSPRSLSAIPLGRVPPRPSPSDRTMNALCRLSVLHLLILLPAGAPRAQSARLVPRDTFDLWFREVSNAGRWGSADELGTLNLISPAKRLAAARTVRAGISVSLSRQVTAGPDINALWPVEVQFRI